MLTFIGVILVFGGVVHIAIWFADAPRSTPQDQDTDMRPPLDTEESRRGAATQAGDGLLQARDRCPVSINGILDLQSATILEELQYPSKIVMRERGVITAVGITHRAVVDAKFELLLARLESMTTAGSQ
jgi:hypothetical protein